jgi:hypothetical protein
MFELTDDVKRAWQWAYKSWRVPGTERIMAEGYHFALAEVRRLEFQLEHLSRHGMCAECLKLDTLDPRHFYTTNGDWRQSVRKELESK